MEEDNRNRCLPFWAKLMLRFLVPEEDYDQHCGDLEEAYNDKRTKGDKRIALGFLVNQIFSSLPNYIFSKIYWGVVMFRNNLKIAIRNFNRSRLFSIINITGLSLGLALVIYIMLFVDFHLGFDQFHKDIDRIYKVGVMTKSDQGTRYNYANMGPMGEAIRGKYPQVEEVGRLVDNFEPTLKYKDKTFKGHLGIYAESEFFRIMHVPIIEGNRNNPLERKNTVILTRSLARKLLGTESAIGKMIKVNDDEMEITAVVEDYPGNTNFDYDLYCSWRNTEDMRWLGWTVLSRATHTYVKLKKDVDPKEFEKLIADIPYEYCGEEMDQKKMEIKNTLIPYKSLHLYSWENGYAEPRRTLTYVYIISGVGLLILLLACMNFMNLSTARSAIRAREVGLRKVIGANKHQLVKQFLGESILSAFISVLFAMILLCIFIPSFNQLTNIDISRLSLLRGDILGAVVLIAGITGIIAGIYPAFFLSKFSPVSVLKGGETRETGGIYLRRILVVSQFVITITLIIVTSVMLKQVNYMKGQNLGFNKEQKIIISLNEWGMITENYNQVKSEFTRHASIKSVTAGSGIPGLFVNGLYLERDNNGVRSGHGPRCLRCDCDFLDVLEVNLLAGRFFEKDRVSTPNESGLVMNESASKMFGYASPQDAVGEYLYFSSNESTQIIGVTSDFHWVGLQTEIEPLVMRFVPGLFKYITLQIDTNNLNETMDYLEQKYAELFPGYIFEYLFADENFDMLYQEEDRLIQLFTTISVLGIIIACLGLLGLSAFIAERKTKEIGIRKVLGASINSVVVMLSKEFALWVFVAALIASPIAYYLMKEWLENFAYRTGMGIFVFVLALLITLAIALGTVITQALKAAVSNPVDSIKYE